MCWAPVDSCFLPCFLLHGARLADRIFCAFANRRRIQAQSLNIYYHMPLSLLLLATVHGRLHLLLLYKTAAAASCGLRRSHKLTGAALFVLLLVL